MNTGHGGRIPRKTNKNEISGSKVHDSRDRKLLLPYSLVLLLSAIRPADSLVLRVMKITLSMLEIVSQAQTASMIGYIQACASILSEDINRVFSSGRLQTEVKLTESFCYFLKCFDLLNRKSGRISHGKALACWSRQL